MSDLNKIMKQLQEKNGEFFTDEVVKQLSETFEESLNERTLVITEKSDKFKEKLEEDFKKETEKLSENYEEKFETLQKFIGEFLDKAATEIVEENKVDYQNVALVNESVSIFKANAELLEKYQIKINSVEEDEELKNKADQIKENYDKLYQLSKTQYEELNDIKKNQIVKEETENLTSLQIEGIESLVESLNYEDFDELREKVKGFKDFITKKDDKKIDSLDENINTINEDDKTVIVPEVKKYVEKPKDDMKSLFLNKYNKKQ